MSDNEPNNGCKEIMVLLFAILIYFIYADVAKRINKPVLIEVEKTTANKNITNTKYKNNSGNIPETAQTARRRQDTPNKH